jgi:p90 ribosomal S6 kinase
MMCVQARGRIHLCDFGSSEKLDATTRMVNGLDAVESLQFSATQVEYVAPEVLSHDDYAGSADLWSLGVVLHEMLTGATPFEFAEEEELMHNEETLRAKRVEKIQAHVDGGLTFDPTKSPPSPEAQDLVQKLLSTANGRLDIQGIKQHPFFTSTDWRCPRDIKAPFMPEIASPMCTSMCDCSTSTLDPPLPPMVATTATSCAIYKHKDLAFAGFQYVCPRIDDEIKQQAVDSPKQSVRCACTSLSCSAFSLIPTSLPRNQGLWQH